jgi:hypothetical protein
LFAVFVLFVFAVIGAFLWLIFAALRRSGRRKLAQYGIPSNAYLFLYESGLANIRPGFVYGWRDENGLTFVADKDGTKRTIPLDRIVALQYNQDIQTFSTGGGRSITGAVVGGVIAGPVGAVVGGRSKAKTKTVDRSTVHLRVRGESDIEVDIIFKGGQKAYQALASLLGAGM